MRVATVGACVLALPALGCEALFDVSGLTGRREADAQAAPAAAGNDAADEGSVASQTPSTNEGGGSDAALPDPGEPEGGGVAPDCTCVPQVPAGWTVVAFSAASAAACPGGYDAGVPLTVDPSLDPVSCSCTCALGAPPSCTMGSVTDHANCGSPTHILSIGNGGCTGFDFGPLAPTHEVVGPPPTGGSCTPDATVIRPSIGTSGFACSIAAAPSGTCGNGGMCAPSVSAPFAVCIASSGSVACPSGYPQAHTAGTSLNDSRACTPCSCAAPSASCSGTLTLYSDTACSSAVAVVQAGPCQTNAVGTAVAYRYAAQVENAACASVPQTAPMPTGSASLTGATTVCCP